VVKLPKFQFNELLVDVGIIVMPFSTVLPDLRVLPTENLIAHETDDPRRVHRLSRRIKKEGFLKNPPVVAAIPNTDRYVILDGANRVAAFLELGIPHIIAQVVSYADPDLTLDTWVHIVSGIEEGKFESLLDGVKGLRLQQCTLQEARQSLATHYSAAYIIVENGVRFVISPENKLLDDIHLLNDIVGAYKGKAEIYRASNDIWDIQKPYYPDMIALVVFPKYTPSDILTVAANGFCVPSGVTRHIIPNRALHINFPLDLLTQDIDKHQKEQWLEEWLMVKMTTNAIRFYSESTFSFDE
jgi:hypothetical protein